MNPFEIAVPLMGFDTLEPYLGEHPHFGALIGRYTHTTIYRFSVNQ
jgi:hypothetical protein